MYKKSLALLALTAMPIVSLAASAPCTVLSGANHFNIDTPGNYCLAHNVRTDMSNPNRQESASIHIGVSNVTLDLKGHALIGPYSTAPYAYNPPTRSFGITIEGGHNLTIRNGVIHGNDTGIRLGGVFGAESTIENLIVEDVQFINNRTAGITNAYKDCHQCTFQNNSFSGSYTGIRHHEGSRDIHIIDNTFTNIFYDPNVSNSGYGINIAETNDAIIQGNTFAGRTSNAPKGRAISLWKYNDGNNQNHLILQNSFKDLAVGLSVSRNAVVSGNVATNVTTPINPGPMGEYPILKGYNNF